LIQLNLDLVDYLMGWWSNCLCFKTRKRKLQIEQNRRPKIV